MDLWRNGKSATVKATVREWPRALWEKIDPPIPVAAAEHTVPTDLGITLTALTDADKTRPGLPAGLPGVKVTGVATGSDAAQRGLAVGDFILQVRDRPVTTVADVQGALAAARAANQRFVMILVLPKTQKLPGPEWVALRLSDG
jgi:serine protease Do